MRLLVSAALVVVAIIHLLPLAGVAGPARLSALYGIPIAEPNLEVLMRHRAVLFGMLGAFLLLAAFRAELQTLALLAGLVSVTSFIVLAAAVGGLNAHLSRVVWADILALVLLLGAGAALWLLEWSGK